MSKEKARTMEHQVCGDIQVAQAKELVQEHNSGSIITLRDGSQNWTDIPPMLNVGGAVPRTMCTASTKSKIWR
jgi:hypothetical protein